MKLEVCSHRDNFKVLQSSTGPFLCKTNRDFHATHTHTSHTSIYTSHTTQTIFPLTRITHTQTHHTSHTSIFTHIHTHTDMHVSTRHLWGGQVREVMHETFTIRPRHGQVKLKTVVPQHLLTRTALFLSVFTSKAILFVCSSSLPLFSEEKKHLPSSWRDSPEFPTTPRNTHTIS